MHATKQALHSLDRGRQSLSHSWPYHGQNDSPTTYNRYHSITGKTQSTKHGWGHSQWSTKKPQQIPIQGKNNNPGSRRSNRTLHSLYTANNITKQWSFLNNEATTHFHSRQWWSKHRLSAWTGGKHIPKENPSKTSHSLTVEKRKMILYQDRRKNRPTDQQSMREGRTNPQSMDHESF